MPGRPPPTGYSFRKMGAGGCSAPPGVFAALREEGAAQASRLAVLEGKAKARKQQAQLTRHRYKWVEEAASLRRREKELTESLGPGDAALAEDRIGLMSEVAKARRDPSQASALREAVEREILKLEKQQAVIEEEDTSEDDEGAEDDFVPRLDAAKQTASRLLPEGRAPDEALLQLFDTAAADIQRQLERQRRNPRGDLTKAEAATVAKLSAAYGDDRAGLVDRLGLELGKKRAIDALHGWEARRRGKALLRAAREEAEEKLAALLQALPDAVLHRDAALRSAETAAAVADERAREAEMLHLKLDILRREKSAKDAEEAAALLQNLEAAARAKEKEEERKGAEVAERMRQLEAYRREKSAKQEEEAKAFEQQAAVDMVARRKEAERNRERVTYREEQRVLKTRDEARKVETRRKAEADRHRLISAIAEAAAPPPAPRDPHRTTGPTAASSSTTRPVLLHEATRQPYNGYTDAHVVGDPRFKLAQALQKADLLSTPYARQVLFSAAPTSRGANGLRTTPENPLHIQLAPPPAGGPGPA